jgi:hypothetical protein
MITGNPSFRFGTYERHKTFNWKTLCFGILTGCLWFLITYEIPWMHQAGGVWDAAATLSGPVLVIVYQWVSDNSEKGLHV